MPPSPHPDPVGIRRTEAARIQNHGIHQSQQRHDAGLWVSRVPSLSAICCILQATCKTTSTRRTGFLLVVRGHDALGTAVSGLYAPPVPVLSCHMAEQLPIAAAAHRGRKHVVSVKDVLCLGLEIFLMTGACKQMRLRCASRAKRR